MTKCKCVSSLPPRCSLDTEVESLREQESVSRILAELLENKEDFFDSEDDDISTTNDYSSINEQASEAHMRTDSIWCLVCFGMFALT